MTKRLLLMMGCLGMMSMGGMAPSAWSADAPSPLAGKYPVGSPRAKISSDLLAYIDQPQLTAVAQARIQRIAITARAPGRVAVRLNVDPTAAHLAAISATGASVLRTSARWHQVSVEATLPQVDALARLDSIGGVVLLRRPLHQQDQGDGVMHTDQLRSTFAITGSGRTIGIISDSIHDSTAVGAGTVTGSVPQAVLTATIPQAGGVLPAAITVIDFGTGGGTDEGEAMCEEIYACAPGAPIAFASANNDQPTMAANIGLLQSVAGCTIVADDVVFPDEPFFQDGPIAQAANAVYQNGGLYFSSAGNNNHSGIMQTYAPVSPSTDPHTAPNNAPSTGSELHNWGAGGTTPGFLPVIIPNGADITFILEWNQPYSSFGLGRGSQSDFDLYVYDSPSVAGAILASSNSTQGISGAPSGDPDEVCEYINTTGTDRTVYLAVDHYLGLRSGVLRVIVYGDGQYTPPVGSTVFGGPTSFGHCCASGALAIAACPWNAPTTVEDFSSKGGWGSQGIPFYFDTAGNAYAVPQLRNKPDLCAPDGISCSNPNFNPFFGTSCAAPNAAVCGALVWEVQPTVTNAQVIARLESTASAVSSPDGPQPDDYTGYGLVNGLLAANGTDIIALTSTAPTGTYIAGTIPLQLTFSGPVTVSGGIPQFTLNTTPPEVATYVSGSGTATLNFTYQIARGDTVPALDVANVGSFDRNGATIQDGSGNLVVTAFPVPGAAGSLTSTETLAVSAVPAALHITAPTLSNSQDITFIFTYSEIVTGFSASKISVLNGEIVSFTAAGPSTYSVVISATAPGAVTATVAIGATLNALNEPSTGGSLTSTYVPVKIKEVPQSTSDSSSSSNKCGLGGAFGILLLGLGTLAVRERARQRSTPRS